jgi:hypothetical protein
VEAIEVVTDGASTLAFIIRAAATSASTSFFTEDTSVFQAGFVSFEGGSEVQAHVHLPVQRTIVGTCELLLVRSGRCLVDIYADHRLVATRELNPGDAILSVAGGHGFRMLEDTVLFEVKQGPYAGPAEKERFEAPRDL